MKRVLLLILLLSGIFLGNSELRAQIPGTPNRWNNVVVPNMDTARVNASVFTVGTKTYVVGGDTSSAFGVYPKHTRTMRVYDHITNTWSVGTPFPGRARVGAVAFGSTKKGKGYYGMGFDSTGYMDTLLWGKTYDVNGMPVFQETPFYRVRFFKDFWEYDTATKVWTYLHDFSPPITQDIRSDTFPLPFMQNGIANASSFTIDTIIHFANNPFHIAGGFMFGEYYAVRSDSQAVYQAFNNTPYFFDPDDTAWYYGPSLNPISLGRSNAVAMILDTAPEIVGKNLVLFAGLGDNDVYNPQLQGIFLKDWWAFELNSMTWVNKPNLPDTGKSNAGAFSFVHLGSVVGGYDSEWSKHHHQYSAGDDSWTRLPDYRDSGRSLGVAFSRDTFGFYGAGFRGNSEEMRGVSRFKIDSNTIYLQSLFQKNDTFCAGDTVQILLTSGLRFAANATIQVQLSDFQGVFEFPVTPLTDMGVFDIPNPNDSLRNDTFDVVIPVKSASGNGYRIRVLSSNPVFMSQQSDSLTVKENISFTYLPKIYPFTDTICLAADFALPIFALGAFDSSYIRIDTNDLQAPYDSIVIDSNAITKQQLTYSWLKDGVPFGDTTNILTIDSAQFSDSGVYRVKVSGDCMADTSLPYYIGISNTPPPQILDDLDYPGQINDSIYHCEFDTSTWSIRATGQRISYQWFHNGDSLNTRDNIEDLGKPAITHRSWNLPDSGIYWVRVTEACGSYVESDSIIVGMREIPRITEEPDHIFPAVLEGVTVGFRIRADGYDLNYRWRKDFTPMNNGPRVTGSFTDTLTISSLIPSDVAFYSCVVCGGCPNSCDTSNLAIIDLNASPFIVKQPVDTLEICEGTDNIISIVASGTNMRYTWRYNNLTPMDPAHFFDRDKRILRIEDAQVGMTGYIVCEVDNQAGASVVSTVCYLKVIPTPPKPVITQPTGSQLSASANCETYVWFYNGVWKGQYNSKIIKPLQSEQGDYTVRVICNGCPSELSDPLFFLSSVVRADLNNLEMYPNPAQKNVVLDLPGIHSENKATVTLYDLSGKLVKTIENVDSENYEIDLKGLSKGMYVVHVTSSQVVFSGKLVKE